jgi:iron complex outermembrane receptor protein
MSDHRKLLSLTTAAAALAALFASPALAQQTAPTDEPEEEEEIVVTGTQIRGVEAAGSAPQRLDREEIEQSGAFSVRELMANIPQLSTTTAAYVPERANSERTPPATFRNLDAFSGTSSTLILIDGGRMAGTGVTQSFADPNIIPPSALERVDLITGGGSAIYGADAVGGVINFVTRTDFDGTEVGARYGFTEDGYSSYSADLAHGWDWDSGSLAVFYSVNGNSELERRDQSNRIYDYSGYGTGGVDRRGLACDPVTVSSGGTFYNSETGTAYAAPPSCNSDSGYAVPEALRHSLFAGLRQDLASGVELQVRAYYATGDTDNFATPTVYSPTVTNAAAPDPAFGGGALATPYTPYFSFDGVRPDSVRRLRSIFLVIGRFAQASIIAGLNTSTTM